MEEKTITTELKEMEQSDNTTIETQIELNKEQNVDFSEFSREQMVEHLKALVAENMSLEIKGETDRLKSAFYLKLAKENAEKKAAFIEANTIEGEETPEFKPVKDALESELKAVLAQYRKIKNDLHKKNEAERESNLKIKLALIEEIKDLITKEESIGKTFDAFKIIQETWKATGPVPSSENNNLWQTYHHHVEHFYDYIDINKELRDLDFKRNLEQKEILCDKAEALEQHTKVIEAFKTLQILHQEWKEIGPVLHELREPLWERFKKATTVVNKRHQDYFTHLKELEIENLAKKTALCEKVEELSTTSFNKAKAWNDNVTKIQELQAEWKKLGPVPKKDNAEIYNRFRKGCDVFFDNKRNFYKQHKDEQSQNLEKKKELLAQAIELKDNDNWKETTEQLIQLQKKWKAIGPVPRSYSNKIWNQFREACDEFFTHKKEFYGGNDDQQKENLEAKEQLVTKISAFTPSDSPQEDIKTLLAFKDEWLQIGHVPVKLKNKINNEYHNELNAQFDKLNLNKDERELEKFRSKLDDLNDNDGDKLYGERKRLSLKLKEMESEIATWENNIGFLSKSKSSEGLMKDYSIRIDKAKQQKIIMIKKIRMIDRLS